MDMTDEEILAALKETDAIRSGHFVLTSGRHSGTYVQCARVLEDPELTTRLAETAVHRLPEPLNIDLVAAPAVGGLIIGFAVAKALGVKFIFSEREQGRMVLRRAFEVPAGAKVLVVEDVVTTGGSVAEVIGLMLTNFVSRRCSPNSAPSARAIAELVIVNELFLTETAQRAQALARVTSLAAARRSAW